MANTTPADSRKRGRARHARIGALEPKTPNSRKQPQTHGRILSPETGVRIPVAVLHPHSVDPA